METLRTPDERFADLADWPYEPAYVGVDAGGAGTTVRMHYIDAGPVGRPTVVLLHGEPTWGYLYRKMIPGLLDGGCRVIVPDLIGFGRSDKPARKEDYTYARHVAWVGSLLDQLDLHDAVFFGQDWGSLVGLAAVAERAARFEAIVLANGGLPDPRHLDDLMAVAATSPDPEAFGRWQAYAAEADSLDVGALLREGLAGVEGLALDLTDAEAAAYDAPFPDPSYQAGALVFPSLVGPHGEEGEPFSIFARTWDVLDRWEKPFLCLYGKVDPVLGWFDGYFLQRVPGAQGQPHRTFPDGGHFIQEQEPEALVEGILAVLGN